MFNPSLKTFPLDTTNIKYDIIYDNSFHSPDDPTLDPSHLHSGYEFYINISGDVCFLVNNKFYPVKKGDVIITKPNDVHICIYNSPCVHEHFCVWLECDESSELLDFTKNNFTNRYSFSEKIKNKILDILTALTKSTNNLEKSVLLLSFLTVFSDEKNIDTNKTDTILPDEMQKILDYIDSEFTQIHNIKEISDKFFISTATLNRWFKKHLQVSPREFLEAKKFAYAKTLLADGTPVNTACIKSGFTDCSYFIAVFKKKFGETPFKFCRKNN